MACLGLNDIHSEPGEKVERPVAVLTIPCHAFTHVDGPLHFLLGGRHIAKMPVDQWVGEAAVVDLTHIGANG
jgi:kynurenine formamidase